MKFLTWKAATLGVIGVLLVGGLAMIVSADTPDTADESPIVQISEDSNSSGMCNMSGNVYAKCEGRLIPIAGAAVDVYTVNITKTNESITITLTKVAENVTDSDGFTCFQLENGKYLVIAHYNGLVGYGRCNLDEDVYGHITMHNWNRQMNQGLVKCRSLVM